LIGLPMRLTLGQKSFEQNQLEVLTRFNSEKSSCDLDSALSFVLEIYSQCR
jgi:prolyl-tRNA synthetase